MACERFPALLGLPLFRAAASLTPARRPGSNAGQAFLAEYCSPVTGRRRNAAKWTWSRPSVGAKPEIHRDLMPDARPSGSRDGAAAQPQRIATPSAISWGLTDAHQAFRTTSPATASTTSGTCFRCRRCCSSISGRRRVPAGDLDGDPLAAAWHASRPRSFPQSDAISTVEDEVWVSTEGESRRTTVDAAGEYRLRLRAYGSRRGPNSRGWRVRVDGKQLHVQTVRALEDRPETFEVRSRSGPDDTIAWLLNNFNADGDRNCSCARSRSSVAGRCARRIWQRIGASCLAELAR
jgi:hypothetical protein